MFLCCPFDAMGCTMATYGGQNVGAAKWERLHQGVRACVAGQGCQRREAHALNQETENVDEGQQEIAGSGGQQILPWASCA